MPFSLKLSDGMAFCQPAISAWAILSWPAPELNQYGMFWGRVPVNLSSSACAWSGAYGYGFRFGT